MTYRSAIYRSTTELLAQVQYMVVLNYGNNQKNNSIYTRPISINSGMEADLLICLG